MLQTNPVHFISVHHYSRPRNNFNHKRSSSCQNIFGQNFRWN